MIKKRRLQKKLKIELSFNEASYLRGMLAAYKQRLELNEKTHSPLISQEIEKAGRLERKFVPI